MFLPEIPFWIACGFSGLILISYGSIKLIGYFSDDLYCLAFQYDLAGGLFLIVLGGIVLGCNYRIADYMYAGLGGLVLLDSLLTIQTVENAKRFGLETWKVMLTASIVAGLLGILVIIGPFGGVRAAHILMGIVLLAEGAMKHCVVKCTVKIMNTSSNIRR